MMATSFSTAAEGIAHEASLFQAEKPAMLIWHAKENALVVPMAVARRDSVKDPMADAARGGWPVVTRGSGGGIVPQGQSTLNLSMIVPMSSTCTLNDGFRLICGVLAEALMQLDVRSTTGACGNAFCDGDWNVLVNGRKFAGTAQRWRMSSQGRVALIHAAILMQSPDAGVWPLMQTLHEAALPTQAPPRAEAHVAMHDFMSDEMNFNNFPGALVRAAQDRLPHGEYRKSSGLPA